MAAMRSDIDPDLAKPVLLNISLNTLVRNDVAVGEIAPLTKRRKVVMALYKVRWSDHIVWHES